MRTEPCDTILYTLIVQLEKVLCVSPVIVFLKLSYKAVLGKGKGKVLPRTGHDGPEGE